MDRRNPKLSLSQRHKDGRSAIAKAFAGSLVLLAAGFFSSCSMFQDPKTTEEYRCAIDLVRKSEDVRKLIGEPVDDSAPATGPVQNEPNDRVVTMTMPISGPKGSGKLMMAAVRDKRGADLTVSFEHNDDVIAIYAGAYPCK